MPPMIRALDVVPPERARMFIYKALRNWRFRLHLIDKMKDDYPIAVLDPEKADAIGSKSYILRLSDKTAVKQRIRHLDIEAKDYQRIQVMLDEGQWFQQGERNAIIFFEDFGKLWRVALRAPTTGSGHS